jgi:hypothetical protein
MLLCSGFVSGSSIVSRSQRSTENCQIIHAKPEKDCFGAISECWSPGQFDLDCSSGQEVCCFDGCVNTCGKPKICKTIYETRHENTTKEMCSLVHQPPICETTSEQECNDVTEVEEEIVTSQVDEDVCITVSEQVCETVESEVCVPPTFFLENPVCPVIHAKPEEECQAQEPSTCWSPGVPDLDCENAALCCFDGCFNHCVDHKAECHDETVDVCQDIEVDECASVPEQVCNDVVKPVKLPVTTVTCTKVGKTCMAMTQENCKNVVELFCEEETVKNCTKVPKIVEKVVNENVCEDKIVPDCKETFQVCTGSETDSDNPYVCNDVPKNSCIEVEIKDCKVVAKTVTVTIDMEICEPYTRPICRNESRPDCQKVETQQCTEEGAEECVTNVTEKDSELIVNQCESALKEVCKKVAKQQCHKATKQVCQDCVKKTVSNKKCKEIPKQKCEKVTKNVQKTVPKEVVKNVCVPKEEETCIDVPDKNVCNNIVVQMSYQVPVLFCE